MRTRKESGVVDQIIKLIKSLKLGASKSEVIDKIEDLFDESYLTSVTILAYFIYAPCKIGFRYKKLSFEFLLDSVTDRLLDNIDMHDCIIIASSCEFFRTKVPYRIMNRVQDDEFLRRCDKKYLSVFIVKCADSGAMVPEKLYTSFLSGDLFLSVDYYYCAKVMSAYCRNNLAIPEKLLLRFEEDKFLKKRNIKIFSDVIFSCARVGIDFPECVLDRFLDDEILSRANAKACSNVISACRMTGHDFPEKVLDRFLSFDLLEGVDFKHCSFVMYSCVVYGRKVPDVLFELLKRDGFLECKDSNICSNIVFSCIKSGKDIPDDILTKLERGLFFGGIGIKSRIVLIYSCALVLNDEAFERIYSGVVFSNLYDDWKDMMVAVFMARDGFLDGEIADYADSFTRKSERSTFEVEADKYISALRVDSVTDKTFLAFAFHRYFEVDGRYIDLEFSEDEHLYRCHLREYILDLAGVELIYCSYGDFKKADDKVKFFENILGL